MHPDDLRGVLNRELGIAATETLAFLLQKGFVADEYDLDIQFLDSLERPFDTGNRTMVTPYRVKRDLHARRCAHG